MQTVPNEPTEQMMMAQLTPLKERAMFEIFKEKERVYAEIAAEKVLATAAIQKEQHRIYTKLHAEKKRLNAELQATVAAHRTKLVEEKKRVLADLHSAVGIERIKLAAEKNVVAFERTKLEADKRSVYAELHQKIQDAAKEDRWKLMDALYVAQRELSSVRVTNASLQREVSTLVELLEDRLLFQTCPQKAAASLPVASFPVAAADDFMEIGLSAAVGVFEDAEL